MSFYTTDNAAPLGNGHLAPVGCVQEGDLERLFTGFKQIGRASCRERV